MQDIEDFDRETAECLISLRSLYNHALVFGANGAGMDFFWDTRTYSQVDNSYDIYVASLHNYRWYKVGRSFLQFVQTFCVENEYTSLPTQLRLHPPEEPHTFYIRNLL
jgi:hypothetical protein